MAAKRLLSSISSVSKTTLPALSARLLNMTISVLSSSNFTGFLLKQWIEHKLLTLTFKAVHGQAPPYLSELISRRSTLRPVLRSNHSLLLTFPKITSREEKSTADRAFSLSAPKLWNSLPEELRNCSSVETFKGKLKTFLFTKYF